MTEDRLRVWTDATGCPDHHLVSFLQPSLWKDTSRGSAYQHSLLGAWSHEAAERVRLTELADCDVAVLPFGLEALGEHPHLWDLAVSLARQAEVAGKVVIVFCHGDRDLPPPGPTCVMLRTSMRADRMAARDAPLPAWVADPDEFIPPTFAPYRAAPVVGFTGQAYPLAQDDVGPGRRAVKTTKFAIRAVATAAHVEGRLRMPPANAVRPLAVLALRRSRAVQPDVVLRTAMTRLDFDRTSERELQLDFQRRLAAADYGYAPRGEGNYSYRLYETLAARRPAVLPLTGMPLPAIAGASWNDICVEVPLRRLWRVGDVVLEWHRAVDAERWPDVQRRCRQVWEEHLSAPGFFRRITTALLTAVGGAGADVTAEVLAAAVR